MAEERRTNAGWSEEHGSVYAGAEAAALWVAYDSHPPEVRALLQDAPFDINDFEVRDFVRQARMFGTPVPVVVHDLAEAIVRSTQECATDWGRGYPVTRYTPLKAGHGRPSRGTLRILR